MTRIGVFSDIHGNSIALKAVLDDIETLGGVDGYWLLGDYAAMGFDPLGVLEMLKTLPQTTFVRGNTDRQIVEGLAIDNDDEDFKRKLEEKGMAFSLMITRVFSGIAWVQGIIETTGWKSWVSELPLEARLLLPDNTRVLLVHASPGLDDGSGLHYGLNERELEGMISGCDADLILCGHTHVPFHTKIGDIQIANCGSVSNHVIDSLMAVYMILEYDENGFDFVHRYVDYDHAAVIRELKFQNHPAFEYIESYITGKRKRAWQKKGS